MQMRLLRAGFDHDEVEGEIATLERVRLLDDEQFARDLAVHATTHRRTGSRGVRQALMAKGVAADTIDEVCAPLADGDADRAQHLAEARLRSLRGLDRATAYRRLTSFLMRRGHAPGTAYEVATRVLGRGDLED
jgi:SOS response regulatory protein OraA/RecX